MQTTLFRREEVALEFQLSSKQAALKSETRTFVDELVVPFADQFDRQQYLSREIIGELKSRGYVGSMISQAYGGQGLDQISIGILNEEIGRGCSSVRSLLTVHGMVAFALERWGTLEQKTHWLPKLASGEIIGAFALTEPSIGTDSKNITSSAQPCQGGFTVNGTKKWITMGQIADVFLLFAQLENQPTAFLIERHSPGVQVKSISGLMGVRASMLAEIQFENCFVPQHHVVGKIGAGLSHVSLSCLDYGRYTIAWGCVGIGQACLEDSVDYAGERKQFGVPIIEHPLIQKMITEMIVNVRAARQLCYKAGFLREGKEPESIMEVWAAKYFSSVMLMKMTNDAVQILGANGCSENHRVQRYFRDAKINEIIEGTTQMHEMIIASNAVSMMSQ